MEMSIEVFVLNALFLLKTRFNSPLNFFKRAGCLYLDAPNFLDFKT